MTPDLALLPSLVLFGVSLLMFGLAALFFAIGRGLKQASEAARSYRRVSARVLSSGVATSRQHHPQHGHTVSYVPEVRYEYEVAGRRYESNRVHFGPTIGFGARSRVDAWVARYPQGSTVAAWINPANPAEAVLETKAPLRGVWTMLVYLFAGLGAACFLGAVAFNFLL